MGLRRVAMGETGQIDERTYTIPQFTYTHTHTLALARTAMEYACNNSNGKNHIRRISICARVWKGDSGTNRHSENGANTDSIFIHLILECTLYYSFSPCSHTPAIHFAAPFALMYSILDALWLALFQLNNVFNLAGPKRARIFRPPRDIHSRLALPLLSHCNMWSVWKWIHGLLAAAILMLN